MQYLGDIFYGGQKATWGKGAVANGTVYLSGVDGIDPLAGKCPLDIKMQTRLVLDKIKSRLADAGTDVNHIVGSAPTLWAEQILMDTGTREMLG